MHSNTISETGQLGNYVSYDVSVQGQINSVSDVFKAVADAGQKGIGVFYWEPAWITVGNDYNSNMQIWEKHGSGWASKAAGEYQEDAAKYHGGSAVDNQALFDKEGNPLDSLYLFSHITSEKKSLKENLLKNPGFESDKTDTSSPVLWKITDTTSGEYSKFTVNSEMVRNGEYSLTPLHTQCLLSPTELFCSMRTPCPRSRWSTSYTPRICPVPRMPTWLRHLNHSQAIPP
jgi:hypothetical protein